MQKWFCFCFQVTAIPKELKEVWVFVWVIDLLITADCMSDWHTKESAARPEDLPDCWMDWLIYLPTNLSMNLKADCLLTNWLTHWQTNWQTD